MVKWYLIPAACFVWLFGVVYRYTIQAFWDGVFNAYYLIRMRLDCTSGKSWADITVQRRKLLEEGSKSFNALVKAMEKFQYSYDGIVYKAPKLLKFLEMWPTWTCTVRVLLYKGMKGNCQDAAHLACVLLRRIVKAHPEIYFKKDVYIPLNPSKLAYTHYIVTGTVKDMRGVVSPFIVSNSHVETNMDGDACAQGILKRAGINQYVWISRKPWAVFCVVSGGGRAD